MIKHVGRPKGNEISMLHEETLQKEQGRQRKEEFLRDWLKDGVESEKESEGEGNDGGMEANVLKEDEPEPSQSHHLSDSSGDSDREEPLLGGMRSSDSDSE